MKTLIRSPRYLVHQQQPHCKQHLRTAESEATPQSLASSLPGSQATPAPSDTTETQAAPQSVDSSSTQNVGEGGDMGSTPMADTTPVPGGYILVRQPVTDPLPNQCHCRE